MSALTTGCPTPVDRLIRELRGHTMFFATVPEDSWPQPATVSIPAPDAAHLAEARQHPGGWLVGKKYYLNGEEAEVAAHLCRIAEEAAAD